LEEARRHPDAIQQAMAFYASIGKETDPFEEGASRARGQPAAKRRSYREMLYLIEQGVLSVEETDAAVCYGPGLRWESWAKACQWHVAVAPAASSTSWNTSWTPLQGMMKALGTPNITPGAKANRHGRSSARKQQGARWTSSLKTKIE